MILDPALMFSLLFHLLPSLRLAVRLGVPTFIALCNAGHDVSYLLVLILKLRSSLAPPHVAFGLLPHCFVVAGTS